jgi:hypothetical protein
MPKISLALGKTRKSSHGSGGGVNPSIALHHPAEIDELTQPSSLVDTGQGMRELKRRATKARRVINGG